MKLFAAGSAGLISRAVVMMQREVADRVSASPGVRDYGLLSATAQMNAQVERLFTLPPSAFSPPPEVYSTVLRLHFAPRFTELGVDPEGFDRFLKQCFAQKRKTLENNLRAAGYPSPKLAAAMAAEHPAPGTRRIARARGYGRALPLSLGFCLVTFCGGYRAFSLRQQLCCLLAHALHQCLICNDRRQRRRDILQLHGSLLLYLMIQRVHLRIQSKPVIAMKKIQLSSLIHREGDRLEHLRQLSHTLVVGVVVGARAVPVRTAIAKGLLAGIGNILRLRRRRRY